ncbi:MAG: LPS export ABC transporter periplasmic protein LptC [Pseudomonadota bacterium]
MAQDAGVYSRIVSITKIVMPLTALGLLSLVFLVEQEDSFDSRGITFAKADLEDLASGLSLRNPQLSGPTSNGGQYFLSAQNVRPTGTSLSELSAQDLVGRLEQSNGQVFHVQAERGTMNRSSDVINLEGKIRIRTDGEVVGHAEQFEIDLAQDTMRSEAQVSLEAPGRWAEADSLFISPPDSAGNRMISLRGGVKVRFTPMSQEGR